MNITVIQNDERTEVRNDGALIGYVENGVLWGIDDAGYAQQIGTVNHTSEIVGKLKEWFKQKLQETFL